MSKKDKKQRHRAKREARRKELRRKASESPIKRLASARGELECWISDDFESFNQLQIFVYKRGAGLSGIACFLIDRGVAGLKDAWTRLDISPEEFGDMLSRGQQNGITLHRSSGEEARKWVAGGVRWAHDNGMRLPTNWAKAASLIDGVGDWHNADVSQFIKEFAGHPEDLRQRLIGEPLETYLQRKDIKFLFSDAAPYKDQGTSSYSDWGLLDALDEEEDEELDDEDPLALELADRMIGSLLDVIAEPAATLAADTQIYLQANGQTPSPELFRAWRNLMAAFTLGTASNPARSRDDARQLTFQTLAGLSSQVEEANRDEYSRAVEQALGHLETDPGMMERAYRKHNSLPAELSERALLPDETPDQARGSRLASQIEHADKP